MVPSNRFSACKRVCWPFLFFHIASFFFLCILPSHSLFSQNICMYAYIYFPCLQSNVSVALFGQRAAIQYKVLEWTGHGSVPALDDKKFFELCCRCSSFVRFSGGRSRGECMSVWKFLNSSFWDCICKLAGRWCGVGRVLLLGTVEMWSKLKNSEGEQCRKRLRLSWLNACEGGSKCGRVPFKVSSLNDMLACLAYHRILFFYQREGREGLGKGHGHLRETTIMTVLPTCFILFLWCTCVCRGFACILLEATAR